MQEIKTSQKLQRKAHPAGSRIWSRRQSDLEWESESDSDSESESKTFPKRELLPLVYERKSLLRTLLQSSALQPTIPQSTALKSTSQPSGALIEEIEKCIRHEQLSISFISAVLLEKSKNDRAPLEDSMISENYTVCGRMGFNFIFFIKFSVSFIVFS
ncbi:hypothetical protein BDZ91DRAFT_724346 [Kalaharituber pfeilii]|nr:hypothetical protein BDZ91DRAFT_724346 [Kalaharituber pfeilii]